jgi:hypothetical protein
VWRDLLVIDAPDFVHRQVNGYPRPIAPDPFGPDEIRSRSVRAADGRGGITLLGIGPVGTAAATPAPARGAP